MKATEFRIGNYIDYKGEIMKLDGSLLCCYIQNELEFPFNPIPLTEEILLKLGFKQNEQFKTNFKFYLKDNEIEINIYNGNNNSWLNDRYVINLKYVHQLQNLYFALTGDELTQVSDWKNKNFV